MEQYLMWMEGKNGVDHHFGIQPRPVNYSSSWEEQAFAEDLRGSVGGFVWPPRSYTCTFCRREFRSAQALGGHMNVHRRDRARLKQSLIINQNSIHDLDHQIITNKNIPTSNHLSHKSSLESAGSNCSRPGFLLDEYYVETNLCVGRGGGGEEEEGSMVNFKRRKAASAGFKVDLGLNPFWGKDSIGEVDLELRLGGSPQLLTKNRVLTI